MKTKGKLSHKPLYLDLIDKHLNAFRLNFFFFLNIKLSLFSKLKKNCPSFSVSSFIFFVENDYVSPRKSCIKCLHWNVFSFNAKLLNFTVNSNELKWKERQQPTTNRTWTIQRKKISNVFAKKSINFDLVYDGDHSKVMYVLHKRKRNFLLVQWFQSHWTDSD